MCVRLKKVEMSSQTALVCRFWCFLAQKAVVVCPNACYWPDLCVKCCVFSWNSWHNCSCVAISVEMVLAQLACKWPTSPHNLCNGPKWGMLCAQMRPTQCYWACVWTCLDLFLIENAYKSLRFGRKMTTNCHLLDQNCELFLAQKQKTVNFLAQKPLTFSVKTENC